MYRNTIFDNIIKNVYNQRIIKYGAFNRNKLQRGFYMERQMYKKIFFNIMAVCVAILFSFNICYAIATDSDIRDENLASISEIETFDETEEDEENLTENLSEEPESDIIEATSSDIEDNNDVENNTTIYDEIEEDEASPSEIEEDDDEINTIDIMKSTLSDIEESLMIDNLSSIQLFGAPAITPIYMYLDGTIMHYTTDSTSPNVLYDGGTIGYQYSYNNVSSFLYGKGLNPSDITEVIIDNDLYPDNPRGLFSKYSQITGVTNIDKLHFDNAISIEGLFTNCSNITSVDMSNWNLSNVQYAGYLFANSGITNVDMSVWQNATSLNSVTCMFMNCSGLANIDLNKLCTQNITDFSGLFYDCSNLKTIDITNFDTSNATTMQYMFNNCGELENIYIGSGFTLPSGCSSNNMFDSCVKLPGYNPSNTDGSMISTYTKSKSAPTPPPGYISRGGGGGGSDNYDRKGLINSFQNVNELVLHAVRTNRTSSIINSDGSYYFLFNEDNNNNIVKKAWVNSDIHVPNSWYLVDTDGTIVTGFAKVSGKYYYLSPEKYTYGRMIANNSININGNIYTFGIDGECISTNLPKIYYDMDFYNSGNKGLVQHNGFYYYFDENGNVCTGLYPVNDALYYFSKEMPEKGKLMCGDIVVDGVHYFCDLENGGKARIVR